VFLANPICEKVTEDQINTGLKIRKPTEAEALYMIPEFFGGTQQGYY
jgi:hypothetical protein